MTPPLFVIPCLWKCQRQSHLNSILTDGYHHRNKATWHQVAKKRLRLCENHHSHFYGVTLRSENGKVSCSDVVVGKDIKTIIDAGTNSPLHMKYEDDGSRVVPVPLFIHGTSEESVRGVYAVLDETREVVYIGMSRDVAASLEGHAAWHGEEVCYVRVMTFEETDVRAMKNAMDIWIMDNDEVEPIGNIEQWYEVDEELWKQASALAPIDLSVGEGGVERDNGSKQIVSPFSSDQLTSTIEEEIVEGLKEEMELTRENVDKALDKVRPFLIADGGNISVIDVDMHTRTVHVRLEGACGSCSSAATTMQLGVEKALRKVFGEQMQKVVAVNTDMDIDQASSFSESDVSVECCEVALDSIRDVLHGLGADVSVVEVDDDEVLLSFRGPSNLKFGVEQTIRDKVPGVTVVTFE